MKHIYFVLLILFSSTSFAQITQINAPKIELVGQIVAAGDVTVSMECYKYEDSTYLFRYSDAEFPMLNEWKSFKVRSNKDFETLYSYIKKGFQEMPKEKVILDIGGEYLFLEFGKYLFSKVIMITQSTSLDSNLPAVGYTNIFRVKQIDILFGKQ